MFFKFLFRFLRSSPMPIDFGVEPQLPPTTTQPVSSSPSSSSFTCDSSWTYDVFLSFRGEDTRTNFTDHLYKALCDKGIYTFIDRELVRGEEISPALVRAIEGSRISLIVFSENYASSRWCLDELVQILQCKESKQQIVLPIFYKVDPSDVRKQTNSFGDAFKGLIQSKFKDDKEKVLIWKEALRQAANLSGWHFEEGAYETTFINNIVDGILSKVLSRTYLNMPKYPVGIPSHVQDVEMLLDVGGNGRHMVGIWGTSGIGKTTIAKAICNAVAYKFEGSCFLPNVGEGSLIQLQETLLQEILGVTELKIASADKGISIIHKLLRHKKILLILDDVNRLEQLDNLAGVGWFGEGSRVIITTQDSRLLKCHGIKLIYEVQKLGDCQALELFSLNAFEINEPPNDYLELAQRAIAFADGLPLALTNLGRHLCNTDKTFWQVVLDSFKGEPYTGIEAILQKSYYALDDYAKEAFLDIACFFNGEEKDSVLQIVPKSCIEVLVDKAMITIEWGGRILMHALLANLGKDRVHKESPNDPGKRSRLWFCEDVKQVLTENTGTRNIKGIMVKLPKPAEITLNPECFRNMVNLQIFINRNASLCGHINYLPNALRLIDWDRCPLQSWPPNFQGNRLVEFSMPRSHIRQLERFNFKHMPNLTYMNLSDSQSLEKIPDLSGIPNIKYLHLSNCTSLVEVDDSVGFLDKLLVLHLNGCVKLTRFGTRLRLKSLKILWLHGCKRFKSFPEIEVEMESLQVLNMEGTGIRELPLSIAYLTGLQSLILRGRSSPELQLLCCWSTLRGLDLSGNNFVTLPECISKFVSLCELDLCDCKSLLEIPQEVLPPRVGSLFLDNCTSLEKIPKLPLSSDVEDKELRLINCFRLRGCDITENIFLDQVSSLPHSQFTITLPGDEVPKWFSCCKDATLVKDEYSSRVARCEVCFEIPPNLDWETLRLVLCVVNKGKSYFDRGKVESHVHINRKMVQSISMDPCVEFLDRRNEPLRVLAEETHVALNCIPLLNMSNLCVGEELTRLQQGNMCQIIFEFSGMPTPVKILCGVHLLSHQVADVTVDRGQRQWLLPDAMAVDDDIHDDQHQDQDNELLSLPSASETSLGKRPRLQDFMALDDHHRGNVVDVGDHEAQCLTLFTGPADHPKWRHIDHNEEPKFIYSVTMVSETPSKDSSLNKNQCKELKVSKPQTKPSKKMKFVSSAETEPGSTTIFSEEPKSSRGINTMPRVVKRKLHKIKPVIEYNKKGKPCDPAHTETQKINFEHDNAKDGEKQEEMKSKDAEKQDEMKDKCLDVSKKEQQVPDYSNLVLPSSLQALFCYMEMTLKVHEKAMRFTIEKEVFGFERQTFILIEDITQFAAMDEIGATVVAIYMRCLFDVLKTANMVNMVGFVDPAQVSANSGPLTQRLRLLANRLQKTDGEQIFFMPYNPGCHWVLVIVRPKRQTVYFLDPLPGNRVVDDECKNIVNSALELYNSHIGRQDCKAPIWKTLQGTPKQPTGVECGYYVMRFMRDIITDPSLEFEKKFENGNEQGPYSQEAIDEVRKEWANFVRLHME